MELQILIKMNENLFVRNPEQTELGRKIIQNSIILIHQNGFESFTFKKLAEKIGTTEAGIYRYFENKHRLLIYIVAWYWSWLEFRVSFETNNISNPSIKLKKIIEILASPVYDDVRTSYINEEILHEIIISEGSKTYLTKHVSEDNQYQFFKPYKDLCTAISTVISSYNPDYQYPRSLATTIIEMAHFQNFFEKNLPSLTDFKDKQENANVGRYLEDLIFAALNAKK